MRAKCQRLSFDVWSLASSVSQERRVRSGAADLLAQGDPSADRFDGPLHDPFTDPTATPSTPPKPYYVY